MDNFYFVARKSPTTVQAGKDIQPVEAAEAVYTLTKRNLDTLLTLP